MLPWLPPGWAADPPYSLPLAIPTDCNAQPAHRGFEASLVALRTLRLLAYRQATTSMPANATSVRDLARVAVAVNERTAERLENAQEGSDRVTPNVDGNSSDHALRSWTRARDLITPEIRGLDNAPAAYLAALKLLHGASHDSHGEALDREVLKHLPELGHQAGDILTRLAATGRLVLATRDRQRFLPVWTPVTISQAQPLADTFHRALEWCPPADWTDIENIRKLTALSGCRQNRCELAVPAKAGRFQRRSSTNQPRWRPTTAPRSRVATAVGRRGLASAVAARAPWATYGGNRSP
jgi:hypothetical protein